LLHFHACMVNGAEGLLLQKTQAQHLEGAPLQP
jgi:hypothetical protein